jgi:biopolymer transport protein ExbD
VLTDGFLKNRSLEGVLVRQSSLKPKGGKGKRALLFTLTLTSLIDAFSILVIFLLTSASNTGQPLDFRGKMQLPLTQVSEELGMGTVVRIESGRYFVNEKELNVSQIPKALYDIKQLAVKNSDVNDALIIQADKAIQYAGLSPVILAASHAGFEKFRFAVLPAGGTIK